MSTEEISTLCCPYCGSCERQVKAGTNDGTQRYKCGACKRRYTPLADGQGYSEAVRAQAVQLRSQGLTIREVARQLDVNHQSVANWLHQQGEPKEEEAIALPAAATGKQRATIHDVARLANVAPSSVSNFLNQKGRMAEPTRARIRAAMDELHFTPSALVRAIQRRRTGILGVMLQSLDSLNETEGPSAFLVPALLRGINDGANAASNDLLLYTGGRQRDRDDLAERFLGGHIDGLIWMTPGRQTPLLERIVAAKLPVVALMTHAVPEGVSYVVADNKRGMRLLVEHLAAQGHRRIAYIGPDRGTDFHDRHEGFREAMVEKGLPWDPALQVALRRHGFEPEAIREILSTLLALDSPPTALLCGNDHLAARFAEAIRARGLRIPDDIALAGFDDMPIAEHIAGGLTTIRQPFRRMGELAAEHLLALVDGKLPDGFRSVLPVELVVRASTALSIGPATNEN